MRLLFDLDNCMYSYEQSGIHLQMSANIIQYYHEKLHLTKEEAKTLSSKHYHDHGLAIAGLMKNHADQVDEVDYVARIHKVEGLEKLITKDERLIEMLTQLTAEGHDMWIFTNGDVNHATRILKCLGCYDFFLYQKPDSGNTEEEGGGATSSGPIFKCMDYKAQWVTCEAQGLGGQCSKPAAGPYEHFDLYAAKKLGPEYAKQAQAALAAGQKTLFVEDSKANLEVPKKLGWGTVLVTHGVGGSESVSMHELIARAEANKKKQAEEAAGFCSPAADPNAEEKQPQKSAEKGEGKSAQQEYNEHMKPPVIENGAGLAYPAFVDVAIPSIHSLLSVMKSHKF